MVIVGIVGGGGGGGREGGQHKRFSDAVTQ